MAPRSRTLAASSFNEALELLHFAFRRITEDADRLLARRGLGRAHHRVLYFVGRNPGVSVGGLLEIMRITKQALHGPLATLVKQGLVSSEPSAESRRVKSLRLTPSGAKLAARLAAPQRRRFAAAFDAAGPDAEEAWREVMRLLAQ